MNEEILKSVISIIQEEGVSLSVFTYIMISIVCVLSGFIGAYLSSYTKEKGKNYATKEDFESLLTQTRSTTKATEEIKSDISKLGLRDSKKWELRFKVYTEVLESLADWRISIDFIINKGFDKTGVVVSKLTPRFKGEMEEAGKRVDGVFLNLARIEAISEIVLSEEQANRIRELKKLVLIGANNMSGKDAFVDAKSRIIRLEKDISREAKRVLFEEDS